MDYLVKDEINASVLERSIRYAHQRQGLLSKLKESAEALERNNVQLQQFAYVASHDLQAPLRRILSFCQLLQRRLQGKLDTDSDEFIGYIVEGAKGMQTLVSDLLTFSRVGTQGKPFKPVDSSVVLDEARRNLEMSVQETNATITRDTLPTVVVDRTQLVQLFQNLLSNAIKYRGDQTPKIHVTAEEKSGEWLFGIRDNGIGIDPKHHSDIFAIFKRLHGDEIPGTGIGLAVCKRIVERHKGRIWVESQLGQGSTFYFTIPKLPVS
jgi:light-regulated signal transduction histidine kinase (bacteriophytochrome)